MNEINNKKIENFLTDCAQGRAVIPWDRITKDDHAIGVFAYCMDEIRRQLEISHYAFEENKIILWTGKVSIYKEIFITAHYRSERSSLETVQIKIESLFKNIAKDFSPEEFKFEVLFFNKRLEELKKDMPEENLSNKDTLAELAERIMPTLSLIVKINQLYEFDLGPQASEVDNFNPEISNEMVSQLSEQP